MNKNIKAGLVVATFMAASPLMAQTGTSASTSSTTTSGAAVGTPMGAGTPVDTSPTNAGAISTGAQAEQNALNAQANATQTNPTQPLQQTTGGGVFGPSKGPGIFGPTSTTVNTDIYGNQQPTGAVTQPSQGTAPVQGARGVQQARTQNPITYDANGQPMPSTLYPQSEVPRDINPILPSGSQQVQPGAGAVTGR